jgi:hypothetical protein
MSGLEEVARHRIPDHKYALRASTFRSHRLAIDAAYLPSSGGSKWRNASRQRDRASWFGRLLLAAS